MASHNNTWTDHVYSPISVLNHAKGLHLDRFTSEVFDHIAGCDDVLDLSLRSAKMTEPVDLSRIAHIRNLHFLRLERLNFTNLQALRALPNLRWLSISDCVFADVEALNGFTALETLVLRRTKLTRFPAGLDLPQLTDLWLSENKISDLGFARSYPRLRELDVSENPVRDLTPLADCSALDDLDLNRTLITGLQPLAGMKFSNLRVDEPHTAERAALQLLLPEETYVPSPAHQEAWRVAKLMQTQDWDALYAVTDLELLGGAFSNLVHGNFDEDTVRGALAHPAPGAFEAMVGRGLRPQYWAESELLVEVLASTGERIIAPLRHAFHAALAAPRYPEAFYTGKMDVEHATIMRILLKAASPAHADLFLTFFNDREGFSEAHLYHYKKLLDVVAKTESHALVDPIIDLLRFEKHIIGGDAAYMKKIFKAVSQLGTRDDAALLASRFNVANEARPDVVAAYEAAVARLEKKKR